MIQVLGQWIEFSVFCAMPIMRGTFLYLREKRKKKCLPFFYFHYAKYNSASVPNLLLVGVVGFLPSLQCIFFSHFTFRMRYLDEVPILLITILTFFWPIFARMMMVDFYNVGTCWCFVINHYMDKHSRLLSRFLMIIWNTLRCC